MPAKEALVDLAKRAYRAFYAHPWVARFVTDQFHRLFYHTPSPLRTWQQARWLGVPLLKCPMDLWVYQEILHEVRPDVILECGTARGGSAYYFASLLDLLGGGRVLSVDVVANPDRPAHPRIEYLLGSSVDPAVLERMRAAAHAAERVLVVLDSDHSRDHVLAELRAYAPLVTPGSYLIVEDTNINGHPVAPGAGPGPMEAVRAFLRETDAFTVDPRGDKFYLTFNPNGYLRKVE